MMEGFEWKRYVVGDKQFRGRRCYGINVSFTFETGTEIMRSSSSFAQGGRQLNLEDSGFVVATHHAGGL
jgi:hypothetical protein